MSKHTHYTETASDLRMQVAEALVDHEAFETLLKHCTLKRCSATCCYDGVYLSDEEAKGINCLVDNERERFVGYGLTLPKVTVVKVRDGMAQKTATRPAEAGELANDFPEHFEKTRCVFLDSIGRCGIQRLCMEDNLGDWYLKPLTCWIHPIVILPKSKSRPRPIITIVQLDADPQKTDSYPGFASCTHCGRTDEGGEPAWLVLVKELRALGEVAGRDIFGELSAPRIDY
ncbi:MAG: hypothetical protein ABGY95_06940 [Rubritalea sp.]|uniref:hypothetical protein n=1 Tax=Rubritalea sp. TaxID=2109375 RepID=UPI00324269A7